MLHTKLNPDFGTRINKTQSIWKNKEWKKEKKKKEWSAVWLSDRDRLKHWRWIVRRIVRYVWKNIKCSKRFKRFCVLSYFCRCVRCSKNEISLCQWSDRARRIFIKFKQNKKENLKKENKTETISFQINTFLNIVHFFSRIWIFELCSKWILSIVTSWQCESLSYYFFFLLTFEKRLIQNRRTKRKRIEKRWVLLYLSAVVFASIVCEYCVRLLISCVSISISKSVRDEITKRISVKKM